MLNESEAAKMRILNEIGLLNVGIAMEIGCNPNTVSKYLKKEWKEMKKKQSKLDPFKEYIKSRIGKYSRLSSVALFKEIKPMGYSGGITLTLRGHVHAIRPNEREGYTRFETGPAEQFQADWGQGKTIVAGEEKVMKYFVMVLGYSRMLYVEFTEDEKLSTLMRCHNKAFEYFDSNISEAIATKDCTTT